MTVVPGKHQRSRYPKRLVTVEELKAKTDPWAEDRPSTRPREPRSPQVRFGQEKGVDWQPAVRDPHAYLAADRRRPVETGRAFVPVPEAYAAGQP